MEIYMEKTNLKPFKIGENLWVVEHEEYGPVILNTKEQKYYYIEGGITYFSYNGGNKCRFFNTIEEFYISESKNGVIPIVCTDIKKIKKRTLVTVMDRKNNVYYFYNVELIENNWVRNEIMDMFKGVCYFILINRNEEAINNCILRSKLKIESGMHLNTPPS